MKISSSLSLSLSSSSLSKRPPPPPSLPISSSRSTFFNNTRTISLFNTTRLRTNSLVLGRPRTGTEKANKGFSCTALFGLGVPELVVIAGVAALVFGPKKLPEVGKSIGKTVRSFQQAAKEFESELKKEPDSETDTPGEKPTAVSEEKKDDVKVTSSKESV
ncbi:sec-independent protein translocase protein TATA, chloroplastic-like [Melia azedarach]|uniref:Sec-independent protein translocase protein TATA, chloroplastic-like n=1 Tax=Melia azedarach TaxID=155640 RepID=A0ACC1Y8V1_MELAZ|nr:sec-independent protein translocase protein TATA, chloroplastic-like [Melia azedarach]